MNIFCGLEALPHTHMIRHEIIQNQSNLPHVVLIPGIGGSNWLHLSKSIPTHPLILIHPSAKEISEIAIDIFILLESLDIKEFTLMGHGLGGCCALYLYTLLRGRDDFTVISLILLSTSCTPTRTNTLSNTNLLFSNPDSPFANLIKPNLNINEIDNQMFNCSLFDVSDQIHLFDTATLIIHGKRDLLFPYSGAVDLLNSIKGSRLVTVNTGHICWENDAIDGVIGKEINAFLNEKRESVAKL